MHTNPAQFEDKVPTILTRLDEALGGATGSELLRACALGHVDDVMVLLAQRQQQQQQQIDVDERDSDGLTALAIAAQRRKLGVVQVGVSSSILRIF